MTSRPPDVARLTSSGPASRRFRCSGGLIRGLRSLYLAALIACGPGTAPLLAQNLPGLPASVEGVAALADSCAEAGPGLVSSCRELALTTLAIQQGVGLATALGSDNPGTASTLGKRLGAAPRVSVAFSAIGLPMEMPRVAVQSVRELSEEESFAVVGLRGTMVAGVLDGFQPAPALGGVLSADLIASYSLLRLPGGSGFSGASSGIGLGTRIGLLRESFTLPGLSVSAVRRWHNDVQAGDVAGGNPGEVRMDLTVSSLRATLGKNWFVLGLMAGVGWDRYDADADVTVLQPGGATASAAGQVRSERSLYFAGGWFNFLISQISLEVGVAEGVSDPFAGRGGGYDPAERDWFVSGAVRVTL